MHVKQLTLFVLSLISKCMAGRNVFCYYTNYSFYRPGNGLFSIEMIDPNLCTHLIYIHALVNKNATIKIAYPSLDPDNFLQFNELKLKYPNLITFIGIGGWGENSNEFYHIAGDEILRESFAKHAANFALEYVFDGIQLCWENRLLQHSRFSHRDKENYSQLLEELRKATIKTSLLLAATVSTVRSKILSYDIPALVRNLDFVLLNPLDGGPWYPVTGHAASLSYVKNTISNAITAGIPAEKIVLGIPSAGRTFKLCDPLNTFVGALSVGKGISGQYTQWPGFIGYNELCEKRLSEMWLELWDEEESVPYTFNDGNWISYENERSVCNKVEYALSMRLSGVLFSIQFDDFNNVCKDGKYPLLKKINRCIEEFNETNSNFQLVEQKGKTITDLHLDASSACKSNGFYKYPNDSSSFYYCYRNQSGNFKAHLFNCVNGLVVDRNLLRCDSVYVVGK